MRRKVKQCEICERYISSSNYNRHKLSCDGSIPKQKVDRSNCNFCGKHIENKGSLVSHERYCKLNPNKDSKPNNFKNYTALIKEGIIRGKNQYIKAKEKGSVYRVSDETKTKISKAGKGRKLNAEQIKKLKTSMRQAVLNNPDSYTANNVSGRTKVTVYNGFKLRSTWELETAKWLDRQNIKWTNVVKGFDYEWEGSTHIYYPDFHLTEYDRYIEVKGYERERDRAKWGVVKDLIIIKKDEIHKIKNDSFCLEL
jgi:hypothetical protein